MQRAKRATPVLSSTPLPNIVIVRQTLAQGAVNPGHILTSIIRHRLQGI
jgi:hypothetical protein